MKYPSKEAKARKKTNAAKENYLIGQLYNKVDTIDEFKVKADLEGFSTYKIWSIVAFYFIWPRFDFIALIIMSLAALGLASAFFMLEYTSTSENPHCMLAAFFGIVLGAFIGFLMVILLFVVEKAIKDKFSLEAPEE